MDISGKWYNELGSTLVIDSVRNGQIEGSYVTAVSATAAAKGGFALIGQTDVDTGGEALAFVVRWQNDQSNCKSVTAWSGQVQTNGDGDDVIAAFWLLTVESSPEDDWYATHVGQDFFWRDPVTARQRAPRLMTPRPPHP